MAQDTNRGIFNSLPELCQSVLVTKLWLEMWAPVREPPQTQSPTPMLCRQPSVARVPRSFSQEEDWLSKACRSGARTSSTALTQRNEDENSGTVQETRRLTRLVLQLQPEWEGRPNLVRLVVALASVPSGSTYGFYGNSKARSSSTRAMVCALCAWIGAGRYSRV